MGIDNLKILCRGYQWAVGTKPEDINFFSSVARTPIGIEIDLQDFLLDLGKLKYSFEGTDSGYSSARHYFESGNLSLKLDSAVYINSSTPYLEQYFKIKEDTTYIKYKVVVSHTVYGLLFSGTVHQDGLKEAFTQGNNSDIIDCMIVGFEKEFRDYYATKSLKSPHGDFIWDSQFAGMLFKKFADLFLLHVDNSFINQYEIESEIRDWWCSKHPVFKKRSDVGEYLLKQGYERIYQSGDKVLNWFTATANCMGWIYYIFKEKFYLRNRSGYTLPTVQYDFGLINEYTIGKKKPARDYDTIMLIQGVWEGGKLYTTSGTPQAGPRIKILGEKQEIFENTWHFNRITGLENAGYILHNDIGHKHSIYSGEDSEEFRIANITHESGRFTQNISTFKKENQLRLNGGSSSDNWWLVNLREGTERPWDSTVGHGQESGIFTGCHGEQLCKINGNGTLNMNYDNYSKSQAFKNNWAKFLDSKINIAIDVEMDMLVTDPFHNVEFINSGDSFFNTSKFGIQTMEFDLDKEITNFALTKII